MTAIKVSETCFFFDIVTTQNDHPRYAKHVFGRSHVFSTIFGYWMQGYGGGGVQGIDTQPACALFHPG